MINDNLKLPNNGKFVMPSIVLNYETFPVSPGIQTGEEKTKGDESKFLERLEIVNRAIGNSNKGIDYEKTIMRISIYDEEAVASPEEFSLLESKISGNTGKVNTKLIRRIDGMSRVQIKNLIKRKYPTINYGASSATINKIDFNANTSGAHNNVLAVEGYGDSLTGNVQQSPVESFSPILMFPATVTLECAGNPMIGMGNQVYIDFGTNTTLDNIYIVKNVTHNINSGLFTSTVELVPTHQGSYKSFRDDLIKIVAQLN